MTTVQQYTEPYLGIFRQPPLAGEGVCGVCHTGTGPGYSTCYSCFVTRSQVSLPTENVVPISLYQVQSQLWHVLRYYKDGNTAQRGQFGTIVAATIARFTAAHWACISSLTGGEPTRVTTVPSTRPVPRPGGHPLVQAVSRVPHLIDLYQPVLVRGPGAVGHVRASDDAFVVTDDVEGHRVLLVEDTFTSGARTQSAASALQLAGAAGVVAVTVGRVIDPGWNENCQRVWAGARRGTFSFDHCVIGH
ncbi:hypothetical protein [Micromonospora sp. NPDC005806]|uniref:hypothetical protein n=1 Tax=Micromonospora sp. NPDC005806 TaxID=3364234 RepID=UPI0036CA8794